MTISNLLSILINKSLTPKVYEDLSLYYLRNNQINESEAFKLIVAEILQEKNNGKATDNSSDSKD